ncbi:MAG: hypothetical protein WC623_22225 [Pedobacter sp.]|uniref:hypothetical protein n=1 Tax=Pedobacter sp. TaxID=1411316 RepID=UPI0035684861
MYTKPSPKFDTVLNELIFECSICHKWKPQRQIQIHDGFDTCIDCDEPVKTNPQHDLPKVIINGDVILPTPTAFNLFYDDFLFFKQPIIPSLNGTTLLLTSGKQQIQLSLTGIIQLLLEKYQHPQLYESHFQTTSPELQVQIRESYTSIQDFLSSCLRRFDKIILFDDPRISEFAKSYYTICSVPLNLKIQYMEWEKTLISAYVSQEIQKGLHEKDKELNRIRQDYMTKLDQERNGNNAKKEAYIREIHTLQSTVESLNSAHARMKEESTNNKNLSDELYEKIKSLEHTNGDLELELSKVKAKSDDLEKQMKRFEKQTWTQIMGFTPEHPTYINKVAGETVSFPCPLSSFASKYSFHELKDGEMIYKSKDSDALFSVPEALDTMLISESRSDETTTPEPSTKEKTKTPKYMELLEFIPYGESGAIGFAALSELSGVDKTNLSRYVKTLKVSELIEEKFDITEKLRKVYRIDET